MKLIDKLSGCCGAVFYPETDICSHCNNHYCGGDLKCKTCNGKGVVDVRDDYHPPSCINERWRTITCPDCEGTGLIEEEWL